MKAPPAGAGVFLTTPALAKWTLAPSAAQAARYAEAGTLRLERALEPGLAAELQTLFGKLPVGVNGAPTQRWEGIDFGSRIVMAETVDPQVAEPLFRAQRMADQDLPALLRALTGRAWVSATPGQYWLRMYCKGSWREPRWEVEPEGVAWELQLSATWPAEWGGHLEVRREPGGEPLEVRSPGFDALDLFAPGPGAPRGRIPVLTRAVQRLSLIGLLLPAEEDPCSPRS